MGASHSYTNMREWRLHIDELLMSRLFLSASLAEHRSVDGHPEWLRCCHTIAVYHMNKNDLSQTGRFGCAPPVHSRTASAYSYTRTYPPLCHPMKHIVMPRRVPARWHHAIYKLRLSDDGPDCNCMRFRAQPIMILAKCSIVIALGKGKNENC